GGRGVQGLSTGVAGTRFRVEVVRLEHHPQVSPGRSRSRRLLHRRRCLVHRLGRGGVEPAPLHRGRWRAAPPLPALPDKGTKRQAAKEEGPTPPPAGGCGRGRAHRPASWSACLLVSLSPCLPVSLSIPLPAPFRKTTARSAEYPGKTSSVPSGQRT